MLTMFQVMCKVLYTIYLVLSYSQYQNRSTITITMLQRASWCSERLKNLSKISCPAHNLKSWGD